MSEEELSALLAKLKDDSVLQQKLKDAKDHDTALAIAKEAGLTLSEPNWRKYLEKQVAELSDKQLEGMAGGAGTNNDYKYSNMATCEAPPKNLEESVISDRCFEYGSPC